MSSFPQVRIATVDDWPTLLNFYQRIYRDSHPLLDPAFWAWRNGDPRFGAAIIAIQSDQVVGHVGVNLSDNIAWIINTYLEPEWRGQGLLRELYDAATAFGPLAATNVNRAGVDMYRKMGWHGLANLRRYVIWDRDVDPNTLLEPVIEQPTWPRATSHHYWAQPGLRGYVDSYGSTYSDSLKLGGLRAVSIVAVEAVLNEARSVGAKWVDYVTSWNDPLCRVIDMHDWVLDSDGPIPWLLDPILPSSRLSINVFSKDSIPAGRIIRRWDSDHGRIGSRV